MTSPQKFRKKPLKIEAIQFTGSNAQEIWDAFGAAGIYGPTEKNPDSLILTTVHGDEAPARAGDWVIPDGRQGTFYPCKPDIFAATYEPDEAHTDLRIDPPVGSLLREYHRRLTHFTHCLPELHQARRDQMCGELIGLRGAVGVALGEEVKGGGADQAAGELYARWRTSGEAAEATCSCDLCSGRHPEGSAA